MTATKPVRVLYCENNTDGTVGGSYYSLLYLVKGLDRSRYEPIVVFYTEHSLLPAFREANIETVIWPKPGAYTFGARMSRALGPLRVGALVVQKIMNFWRSFVIAAIARAWYLVRRQVRIVHLNNSVLYNHDWMFAARLTGRVCVTHERGINDHFPAMARYFGRRLDAVICISEAVRENMRRRGANFENLVTIFNGLDPSTMTTTTRPEEIRRSLGLEPMDVVVGMIGNIRAWKGQDTLVHAVDRVRRTVPAVRCVLVGDTSPADREYGEQLTRLVAELGLERHVVFAGFRRNVADFLMMFDVVVHTSVLPEPFGRVILEAMACRKAVIASGAGAIPEIVEEGRTGLMFPPGDADALAEAITRLTHDRREFKEMGERGYERLLREFHITRNVEATQRLYETRLRAAS